MPSRERSSRRCERAISGRFRGAAGYEAKHAPCAPAALRIFSRRRCLSASCTHPTASCRSNCAPSWISHCRASGHASAICRKVSPRGDGSVALCIEKSPSMSAVGQDRQTQCGCALMSPRLVPRDDLALAASGRQLATACINADIFIVAKLEKVSDTA